MRHGGHNRGDLIGAPFASPRLASLFFPSAAPAANGPRKGLSPPNIAIQHDLTSCPRHADTGRRQKEGFRELPTHSLCASRPSAASAAQPRTSEKRSEATPQRFASARAAGPAHRGPTRGRARLRLWKLAGAQGIVAQEVGEFRPGTASGPHARTAEVWARAIPRARF
jgi:hypothetical protein